MNIDSYLLESENAYFIDCLVFSMALSYLLPQQTKENDKNQRMNQT